MNCSGESNIRTTDEAATRGTGTPLLLATTHTIRPQDNYHSQAPQNGRSRTSNTLWAHIMEEWAPKLTTTFGLQIDETSTFNTIQRALSDMEKEKSDRKSAQALKLSAIFSAFT